MQRLPHMHAWGDGRQVIFFTVEVQHSGVQHRGVAAQWGAAQWGAAQWVGPTVGAVGHDVWLQDDELRGYLNATAHCVRPPSRHATRQTSSLPLSNCTHTRLACPCGGDISGIKCLPLQATTSGARRDDDNSAQAVIHVYAKAST
eukprot:353435-Chlamydomonas_euryale.AAC.14